MSSKVKILLFDIETAPNLAFVWGKYEQDVIAFEGHWYLLSFSAKWLGSSKVHAYGLNDFKGFKKDKQNDKALTEKLWEFLNEADVVIAHNGDQFDVKKANALFVKHGMRPPKPFKSIDTKKVAKRYFRFDSNKLDDLGDYLKIGRKMQTGGFELWKGCMDGDSKSWRKMLMYNRQDVILLEKIYLKLRSWMQDHPNMNMYLGMLENCVGCGSSKVQRRGFATTRTGKTQRFHCQDCGMWSLGKTETVKGVLK